MNDISAQSCPLQSLCCLLPGQDACITDLSKTHKAVCHRLLDLGVTEGTHVQLKRTSLFGGPLMLEANGQLFGLRRREALRIGVVIG
ncbi:FeoA family protein [Paenibacillus marinisediminis]